MFLYIQEFSDTIFPTWLTAEKNSILYLFCTNYEHLLTELCFFASYTLDGISKYVRSQAEKIVRQRNVKKKEALIAMNLSPETY